MSALYERAYDDSRLAAQTVAPEIGNRTDIRLLASEGRDQVSFGELKRLVLDLEETNEYGFYAGGVVTPGVRVVQEGTSFHCYTVIDLTALENVIPVTLSRNVDPRANPRYIYSAFPESMLNMDRTLLRNLFGIQYTMDVFDDGAFEENIQMQLASAGITSLTLERKGKAGIDRKEVAGGKNGNKCILRFSCDTETNEGRLMYMTFESYVAPKSNEIPFALIKGKVPRMCCNAFIGCTHVRCKFTHFSDPTKALIAFRNGVTPPLNVSMCGVPPLPIDTKPSTTETTLTAETRAPYVIDIPKDLTPGVSLTSPMPEIPVAKPSTVLPVPPSRPTPPAFPDEGRLADAMLGYFELVKPVVTELAKSMLNEDYIVDVAKAISYTCTALGLDSNKLTTSQYAQLREVFTSVRRKYEADRNDERLELEAKKVAVAEVAQAEALLRRDLSQPLWIAIAWCLLTFACIKYSLVGSFSAYMWELITPFPGLESFVSVVTNLAIRVYLLYRSVTAITKLFLDYRSVIKPIASKPSLAYKNSKTLYYSGLLREYPMVQRKVEIEEKLRDRVWKQYIRDGFLVGGKRVWDMLPRWCHDTAWDKLQCMKNTTGSLRRLKFYWFSRAEITWEEFKERVLQYQEKLNERALNVVDPYRLKPTIMRYSLANKIHALMNRLGGVNVKPSMDARGNPNGVFREYVDAKLSFIQLSLEDAWIRMRTKYPKFTILDYFNHIEPSKRQLYARGFVRDFCSYFRFDMTMEFNFKKMETQAEKTPEDNKGRGILDPPRWSKLLCGWVGHIVTSIVKNMNEACLGLSMPEVCARLTRQRRNFSDPVFVSMDISNYDGSNVAEMCEAVDSRFVAEYLPRIFKEYNVPVFAQKPISRMFLSNGMPFKVTEKRGKKKYTLVKGECHGLTYSGSFIRTTCGNTLRSINLSKMLTADIKSEINCAGDDILILIERADLELVKDRVKKLTTPYDQGMHGIGYQVKKVEVSTQDCIYLSRYFCVTRDGSIKGMRMTQRVIHGGVVSKSLLSAGDVNASITEELSQWTPRHPFLRLYLKYRLTKLDHSTALTRIQMKLMRGYTAIEGSAEWSDLDYQDYQQRHQNWDPYTMLPYMFDQKYYVIALSKVDHIMKGTDRLFSEI
jgi:hypothetical protein